MMTTKQGAVDTYLIPTTDRGIAAIPLPDRQLELWHADVKGLHIRITPTGGRTWRLQYRDATRTLRRLTLGKFPGVTLAAAVAAAKVHLGDIARGADPAKEREQAKVDATRAVRFWDAAQGFLAWSAARNSPRHAKAQERYLERMTNLHAISLAALTHADLVAGVAKVRDGVTKGTGDITGNRAQAALSACVKWLAGQGLVDRALRYDALSIPKAREAARQRVLTGDEMLALWRACDVSRRSGQLVRMLILTGARREAIGSLQWSQVNGDAITFDGLGASNKGRFAIPMTPEIAAALPVRGLADDYVYGRGAPFSGWSKLMTQLRPSVGEGWSLHTIRHTISTVLNNQPGVSPHVVEDILSHKSRGTAAVYNHSDRLASKAEALAVWYKVLRSYGCSL